MATAEFQMMFKNAYAAYMNGLNTKGVPSWAKDDWTLAKNTGLFDSARPTFMVNPERLLSRQEVAYLFEKMHLFNS